MKGAGNWEGGDEGALHGDHLLPLSDWLFSSLPNKLLLMNFAFDEHWEQKLSSLNQNIF